MKKVLIKSYLDLNLGDSLLLEILLDRLKYYNCILIADNKFTYQWIVDKYSNVTIVNEKYIDRTILNTVSSFIRIGGSIFQHNYWYDGILRYKDVFSLKKYRKYGIKFFIINCNIGPFLSHVGVNSTTRILSMANTLTCRDSFSLDFIKKHTKNQNVKQFTDLVFAYDVPINKKPEIFTLGISVYTAYIRNLTTLNYQYCEQILKIIQYFNKIYNNLRIKIFIFDAFRNNDFPNAYFIAAECKKQQILYEIIAYNGCAEVIIDEMSKCSFFIGTRFHSIVLTLKMRIPCIPIIYSNKTYNLLSDLEYDGIYFRFGEPIKNIKKINIGLSCIIDNNKLHKLVNNANDHLDFILNNLQMC